jgi:flagellar biosynthetic protein FlhB
MGASLMGQLSGLMKDSLRLERALAFDPQLMLLRLHQQAMDALLALLPLLLVLLIAALCSPLLLNGWLFTLKSLQPDFQRLNPAQGMARIFSLRSLAELAKAVAKTLVIGGVAVWVMWHHKDAVFSLATQSVDSGIAHLGKLLGFSFLAIVGSMLLIVVIDVPFQLWEHGRKLRMTREELRQEAKETEGDPKVKARIRSLQREAARRRMMAEIPKADVVVTNPAHYAVALRYHGDTTRAPRVVAKGAHLLAARIRELAQEHRVPILEAPPLARALYRHTDLGDEIPETLYTAVAEVLAYVFQLRRYREYGGTPPQPPQEVPVPEALDPQDLRQPRAAG